MIPDEIDVDQIHDYVDLGEECAENEPETGEFTINLEFGDGDLVTVKVSNFRDPANAAAALFRIGQPEALDEIFEKYKASA